MQDLQALAELTQRKMSEQNLSLHDVEARARRAGFKISHATVGNILNQTSKEVKASTLSALARGIGVSEEELRAVVFGDKQKMTLERFIAELEALGVEDFNPAKGMSALSAADMEEIIAVARSTVRAMVEQKIKNKKK